MPVSGLLLTVDPDPARVEALRAALADDPRTSPGDLVGSRLVVVLDTVDRAADEDAWTWLRALVGVRWVDLTWISIDPADDVARPGLRQSGGADPADARPALRPALQGAHP